MSQSDVTLHLKLSQEVLTELNRLAKLEHRTRHNMLQVLVREAIVARGKA